MATKIVTKNSSTASAVPTASDLVQGELAVNVADKRLFTEDNTGTIVELGTNPSTIDINAGSIDGTAIGASSASTGAFTTLTATGLTVDTNTLYVDSTNNRVGIGTTSPSDTLSVNGQIGFFGNDGQLKFNDGSAIKGGNNYGDIRIQTDRFRVYNEAGSNLAMNIDSSGRVLLNRTASTGSLTLESQAPSGFSIGSGFYSGSTQSTIEFKDSNTTANYKVRIGSQTDDMVMFAGGSERLRIDSSGNVGIGTSSPSDALHIKSSSTDARLLLDGHTNFDAELKFAENGSVKYTIGHDAGSDQFRIATTNVDTNPRMIINSSG